MTKKIKNDLMLHVLDIIEDKDSVLIKFECGGFILVGEKIFFKSYLDEYSESFEKIQLKEERVEVGKMPNSFRLRISGSYYDYVVKGCNSKEDLILIGSKVFLYLYKEINKFKSFENNSVIIS